MTYVLLIVHLFVTLALIGVVLIQRSEGGGLGIGTSQGMGSFMSGRGTANLLTRATSILGTIFFVLSLALALLNRGTTGVGRSILDTPAAQTSAPTTPPVLPTVPGMTVSPAPAAPAAPPPASAAPSPATPPAAVPSSAVPSAPAAPAPESPAPAAVPAPTPAPTPAPPAASAEPSAVAPVAPAAPSAPAAPPSGTDSTAPATPPASR